MLFLKNIYLAASGLSCITWCLPCSMLSLSLQCRDSLAGVPASEAAEHGLSSWGAQTLEHTGSVIAVWAELLRGVWDLNSQARIKSTSSALPSGFLITGPPGKSPQETLTPLPSGVYDHVDIF